jgi:hypothetical protein
MPLRIANAIICDHVRIEDNGKHILIGVYVGNIAFPGFPGAIAPTFWIQFTTDKKNEELELEFKLEGPPDAKESGMTISTRSGEERAALVVLNVAPVFYHGPGHLAFHVRQKGGKWIQALRKDVVGSTPPAT